MPVRRRLIVSLGCVMVVGLAGPAWATIDNQKSFKAAYPGKDAKAYSCKVCHEGAVGKKGDLNAYGAALQTFKAEQGAKKLTVEDYKALDEDDADEDGAANLQEWEAGTNWADPKSVPAGVMPVKKNDVEHKEDEGETEEPHSSLPQVPGASSHLRAYLQQLVSPSAWAEDAAKPEEPPASKPGEGVKAEYVGMETCAACHADIASRHQRSPHAKIGADGPGGLDISCESCHGPGSVHAEAGGGRGVGGIINPSEDPSTCFSCHTDKKMEFSLQYHHPVPEGRMSCTDCHAPHGVKPTPRAARAQNELCLSCHQQLKGPWVFEHLALRDGCLTCHQPHGSITTRLLTERDFNLCLKCHFSGLQYQSLGHYAHRRAYNPAGKEGANCTGCHRAVHGSNFSKELRTQ